MSKTWIQSFSGKKVEPGNLLVEMVSPADIGHALAQKTRFSGHLNCFYSVAQHCVIGAGRVGLDDALRLAFLLHEVSEVYLPDVPTPIKRLTSFDGRPWTELEDEHARVILSALGLSELYPLLDSPEVHECDLRMLMTEKRDLLGPSPEDWGIDAKPYKSLNFAEYRWSPEESEFYFNREFARLDAMYRGTYEVKP